jgi:hypothetical protein
MHLIEALEQEEKKLEQQLEAVRRATACLLNGDEKHKRPGRKPGWHMTAEQKAKIGRAARKRWAELRKN